MGITYAHVEPDTDRTVDLGNILSPVVTPEPTAEPVLAAILTPEPEPELAVAPNQAPVSGQSPEPKPLQVPGNMTVMDDISNAQAADKEFLTVTTRSGAIFYIVIDKASGDENVHFLNQVDDSDLQALLADKNATPSITPTPTVTPEATPIPEATPEPEKKTGGAGGVVLLIVLLAALGGGAYYYFKVFKPKQNTAKTTSNTEYDEMEFEDENRDENGESEYGGVRDTGDVDMMPDIPEFDPLSEPSTGRGSGRDKPRRSAEDDFTMEDSDQL